MKRTTAGPVIVVIALAALLLPWAPAGGEGPGDLYIVPLDDDLLLSGARDLGVFVLSGDEALIEAGPEVMDRLNLGAARLGPRGTLPLWVSPSPLPADLLREGVEKGGLEIVQADGRRVIFRADPETAYGIDVSGHLVTRIRFVPLSRLTARPDMRPVRENLLESRPLTEARLDFMRAMTRDASADSLRDIIYFLNYDSEAGGYRSRFAARYDLDEDVTPVLYDRLRGYLEPVGGEVHTTEFPLLRSQKFQGQAGDGTNILGEKPGARTGAYYVICSHFDATASRDPGFDTSWVHTPAPGGDDNATGVATVLECARLLAPLSLDFGVIFALFSAEENLGFGGMQGSAAFVDALSDADSIIGVINVDMIGYMEDFKKAEISYGWRSEWLASELEATAESLGLDTPFEAFHRADVHNSDHASFWLAGIPALMLSERTQEGSTLPIYPYYHTSGDTLGNVDMLQVRDNAALVVGYLSRFADIPGDSLCDIEITPASVEFYWDGRSIYDPLVAGDDLALTVRALNKGGPMHGSLDYDFEVRLGRDRSGPIVHESEVELSVVPGGVAVVRGAWKTEAGVYGEVFFTVSLLPVDEEVEGDLTNNEVTVAVAVSPRQTVLRNFHVYPNPAAGPADATLGGDILTSQTNFLAAYVVQVFDVTGLRLLRGEGQIDSPELVIPLSGLAGDASRLVPGLYICTIDLNIRDEDADLAATTKFAVVSGP